MCDYLYYILISLWAITIVDYLFLSTIWFNRGRLTWNSQRLIYKVNTTAEPWNLHVIDMILNFKCTDFFTVCQKERCVSLLIIHCDVAWYNVEWWPRHSFDLCNNRGRILNNELSERLRENHAKLKKSSRSKFLWHVNFCYNMKLWCVNINILYLILAWSVLFLALT